MKKIHITTNFVTGNNTLYSIYLEEGKDELMQCLKQLQKSENVVIIDEQRMDIYPDIEITLNSIDYYFLPKKLATVMNDEDVLSVSLLTMGGG
jgi:hypothetical protein